jgi:hypothetical protein
MRLYFSVLLMLMRIAFGVSILYWRAVVFPAMISILFLSCPFIRAGPDFYRFQSSPCPPVDFGAARSLANGYVANPPELVIRGSSVVSKSSGALLSARLPSASRVTPTKVSREIASLLSGATSCTLTPPATFLTSRTSSSPSLVWCHASTWPSTATTLPGFWKRTSCLSYCATPYCVRLGAMRRDELDTKMSVWNPIQRLLLFLPAIQQFCISYLASHLIIAVSECPDSPVKSSV